MAPRPRRLLLVVPLALLGTLTPLSGSAGSPGRTGGAGTAEVVAAPGPPGLVPAALRGEWPLRPAPRVVTRFDPPDVRWGRGHRGVDLAGHVGQQVRTALPGTVRFAGVVAGRGVVVVQHDGRRTTYQPVTASVREGETLVAGAPIGRLELFGSHCLPLSCLHWGLVVAGDYRDPLTLVGPGPVRLLPLCGCELPRQARGWAWR